VAGDRIAKVSIRVTRLFFSENARMKKHLLIFSVIVFSAVLHAADDAQVTALRAADDERVAAMIAADKERLAKVLSDDLRYAHSNGAVDTKTSLSEILVSGKTKYNALDYEERNFTFPAPGIALMTGRVHAKVTTASGGIDAVMSYLAVWREEKGQWHFLAWQSCKIPPPAAPAK
jgi:hypothetical protein